MRIAALSLFALLVAFIAAGTVPGRTATAEEIDTQLYGSNDTFVIESLGIKAPVNVRKVGADGRMGDPYGKDDVVRYEFPTMPGLGGYPGNGGTAVVAGHVDYRPNFEAVFWTLRQAKVGTQIDYYRGDGYRISYVVDYITTVGGNDDVSQFFPATGTEAIVMISCEGSFNPATREYDRRTLVHAVRVS
jgi:hypothetical protein